MTFVLVKGRFIRKEASKCLVNRGVRIVDRSCAINAQVIIKAACFCREKHK